MRNFIFVVGLVWLSACGPKAIESYDPAAVQKDAASAFQAYVTALNDDDLETARNFYDDTPGFHWIEKGRIHFEDGEAAAKALTGFGEGPGKSVMTIDDMRVAPMGPDAAFVSAKYRFSVFFPGGDFMEIPGWMSVAMVRRDEEWKIAGGMTDDG